MQQGTESRGLAGLHNPAGGLGGTIPTTGRQGPPSAGRSPSPGVTYPYRFPRVFGDEFGEKFGD